MQLIINNRYKVQKELGAGTMGIVYLALDSLFPDKQIAVKVIHPEILNNNNIEIFKNEFDIMTRLNHPHLVKVHDFGKDYERGNYFLTMQYIHGNSLTSVLHDSHGYVPDKNNDIMISLLRVLDFIHSRNIIHRDIKPENIIISNGQPILMDFGLADIEQTDDKTKGTLSYMAPEGLGKGIDSRSDIFSLGLVFYEMITRQPFYEDQDAQIILELLSSKDLFEKKFNKQLELIKSIELRKILSKMLAFEPDDRFSQCPEILHEFNNTLDENIIFETTETKAAYITGSRFIGREKEFSKLIEYINDNEKPLMLIHGEAGVGKSRLMFEFKKYCQLKEIILLETSAYEHISTAYYPLLFILKEALLNADVKHVLKYGSTLKKIVPDHPRLLDIPCNEYGEPEKEKEEQIDTIVNFILDYFFQNFYTHILYLNDTQWADENTLEVIYQLFKRYHKMIQKNERLPGFFIVLTSREEGLDSIYNVLDEKDCETLHLQAFNSNHVKTYITTMFGNKRLGPKLLDEIPLISNKVGGNPFYLQELIKSFVEKDIIYRDIHYWEIKDSLKNLMIPESIQDLIATRLDSLQLNSEYETLLLTISLLDREIDLSELNLITHVKQEQLDTLVAIEILKTHIHEQKCYFTISHDLIREAVLAKNPKPELMHNSIAVSLEKIHQNNQEQYLEELAYHFYQAKNTGKAIFYLEKSILKAIKLFENVHIIEYGTQLLSIIDENDTKRYMETLISMVGAYRLMGKKDLFLKHSKEVIELAEKNHDNDACARVFMLLGRYYLDILKPFEALDYYEKSLLIYKKTHDKANMALCYNYIGCSYILMKDRPKALEFLHQAYDLALEIGDLKTQAFSTGNIGYIELDMGNYEHALEKHAIALEIIRELEDKENEIIGLGSMGETYLFLKRFADAARYTDEAIMVADSIDAKLWKSIFTIVKGEIMLEVGRIDEAEELFNAAKDYIESSENIEEVHKLRLFEIHLAQKRNNLDKVKSLLASLIGNEENKEFLADYQMEMWRTVRDDLYRKNALDIYKDLYTHDPKHIYKIKIEELTGGTAHERDLPDEGSVYKRIKNELNIIQGLLQTDQIDRQFHLHERNRLAYKKILEIDRLVEYFEKNGLSTISIAEEKKKISFFKDLLDIIHDLNSNYTLDTLLEKVLDTSIRLMDAGRGVIMLYSREGNLEIKKARNVNEEDLSPNNYRLSQTVIRDVIEKEEALFVANIAEKADLSTSESILDLELQSVMCAPLGRRLDIRFKEKRKYPFLTATQKLGIIYLDNKQTVAESNFIGSNLNLFQALADQASIAILNTILYEKVNIDALTGLYLRPFFEQSLESELVYCNEIKSHISVFMIDVDFFKMINDQFGHQVGDEVLKMLGQTIKDILRQTDICGRYGGEEFIVLLPNTDTGQAIIVAKKLQDAIRNTLFPSGRVTVSIGISSFPTDNSTYVYEETARKIIKNADQALYHAKITGRNKYVIWSPKINDSQEQATSITDILSGNPIRDYKNVQMLLEVIKIANSDLDLPKLLDRILAMILKFIDADRGIIFLLDQESHGLTIKAVRERVGKLYAKKDYKYSKQVVNNVFETGQEIYSNAIIDDIQSQSVIDLELMSVMCVPLITKGKNIGVIYIDSKKRLKEFSINELSFFKAIATQVTFCIKRVYTS